MQAERKQEYKMYKHNIDDINIALLLKTSGVDTYIYLELYNKRRFAF